MACTPLWEPDIEIVSLAINKNNSKKKRVALQFSYIYKKEIGISVKYECEISLLANYHKFQLCYKILIEILNLLLCLRVIPEP